MRPRVAKTTINATYDFAIGRRLTNLPAPREIGFSANRRLLRVQRLSHDPADGADALAAITDPITTDTGQRVPGLRFTDPRARRCSRRSARSGCCPAASPTATCATTWRPNSGWQNNQDAVYAGPRLLALADGMGGLRPEA